MARDPFSCSTTSQDRPSASSGELSTITTTKSGEGGLVMRSGEFAEDSDTESLKGALQNEGSDDQFPM